MQKQNKHAIIRSAPPEGYVPLRGASGRLYGYIDPQTLIVEFKRKNEPAEQVDLKTIIQSGMGERSSPSGS